MQQAVFRRARPCRRLPQAPHPAAPIHTYRWVHFPWETETGIYTYRVTKMHMPTDNTLEKGLSIELPIELGPVTLDGFLDVGIHPKLRIVTGLRGKKKCSKSGPVRQALDNLMKRPVFSYGVVNESTGMKIHKPGGEI